MSNPNGHEPSAQLYKNVTYFREAANRDPELSPIFVPLIEAPKWFGVSRDTIYRQSKKGSFRIYKAGGRSVLKVAEVQNWIEGLPNSTC